MNSRSRERLAGIVAPIFVPGHRPERFAKAAASGADAVILDLEDAVPPDAKATARTALTTRFTDLPVLVRVNAAGTPWHADDVAALATLPIAGVMLPKAERVANMESLCLKWPVVALVETVRGIAAARGIAASDPVVRLAFGSVDYAADLGCAHEREPLAAARAELVFASRLADLPPPFDGVTTTVDDPGIAGREARYARDLGFGGKLLIHPNQVGPVIDGFAPTADELEWAHNVLATGGGAVLLKGAMIDDPVRVRARSVINRLAAK